MAGKDHGRGFCAAHAMSQVNVHEHQVKLPARIADIHSLLAGYSDDHFKSVLSKKPGFKECRNTFILNEEYSFSGIIFHRDDIIIQMSHNKVNYHKNDNRLYGG